MAEVGADVELSCDVDSNPTPSIVWLREGSNKIIGYGATHQVKVMPSTAGTYKCIVKVRGHDFEFRTIEGKARVLVKGPPKIVSDSEQQGRKGDTISLECSSVSVPSPIRVTWTHKGKKIEPALDPRYDVVKDERESRVRHLLVIHSAASSDFGDYNCSVVNEYGVARKLIRLKEEKRVSILIVVGCAAGVVVVAMIVIFLVICNKRQKPTKESSKEEKEKTGEEGDQTNSSGANMYSTDSENKPDHDNIRSSTFQGTINDVKDSPIGSNRAYIEGVNTLSSYTMKPINGETQGATPGMEQNFESDYSAFIGSATTDVRRSSLTDITIYPSPLLGPTSTTSEFCTIRRNINRAPPSDPLGNNAKGASIHPVFSAPHPNGSVGTLPGVPLRPLNGSIQTPINRHSTYVPHPNASTCTQPPPPPYPRSSSNLPHDGVISPKPITRQNFSGDLPMNDASSPIEAKYIFSPEAMLKPGTLV